MFSCLERQQHNISLLLNPLCTADASLDLNNSVAITQLPTLYSAALSRIISDLLPRTCCHFTSSTRPSDASMHKTTLAGARTTATAAPHLSAGCCSALWPGPTTAAPHPRRPAPAAATQQPGHCPRCLLALGCCWGALGAHQSPCGPCTAAAAAPSARKVAHAVLCCSVQTTGNSFKLVASVRLAMHN